MHICLWGFPGGSDGKESACNVGDPGSIPGSGRSPGEGNGTHYKILAWRSPGEGNGYRLQYSGLVNSMDCIVRGVPKSQTGSDFHFGISTVRVL